MKFKAAIHVMPLKELLDPQGKAVEAGLANLELADIQQVRIGKHIELEIEAKDRHEAKNKVDTACKKLLANPVIEYYDFTLSESAATKQE